MQPFKKYLYVPVLKYPKCCVSTAFMLSLNKLNFNKRLKPYYNFDNIKYITICRY